MANSDDVFHGTHGSTISDTHSRSVSEPTAATIAPVSSEELSLAVGEADPTEGELAVACSCFSSLAVDVAACVGLNILPASLIISAAVVASAITFVDTPCADCSVDFNSLCVASSSFCATPEASSRSVANVGAYETRESWRSLEYSWKKIKNEKRAEKEIKKVRALQLKNVCMSKRLEGKDKERTRSAAK